MSATLAICVMHAAFDTERRATLDRLLKRVQPFHIEEDRIARGAWPVAQRCWLEGLRSGASHVVVMNDDALPCRNFAAVAGRALDAQPDRIVCFYTAHPHAVLMPPWYTTVNGLVGVACAMPTWLVAQFLEWEHTRGVEPWVTDDGRINLFAMATDRLIFTTRPSLVGHQLPASSLVGNECHAHRVPVVPPDEDGARMLAIDWAAKPEHLGRQYKDSHWWMLSAMRGKDEAERQRLVGRTFQIERHERYTGG